MQSTKELIEPLVFSLLEDFTQHWMHTGEMPKVTQMIQLAIYLEQLGVIYPQRLNLCEELLQFRGCNDDKTHESRPEFCKCCEGFRGYICAPCREHQNT